MILCNAFKIRNDQCDESWRYYVQVEGIKLLMRNNFGKMLKFCFDIDDWLLRESKGNTKSSLVRAEDVGDALATVVRDVVLQLQKKWQI